MKIFYLLVLLVGLHETVLMQITTFALPSDAYVATMLAKEPDRWVLVLDDGLKSSLGHYDMKTEVTAAMKYRASYTSHIYSNCFWRGAGLVVLSVVGLIRERQLGRRSRVEISNRGEVELNGPLHPG